MNDVMIGIDGLEVHFAPQPFISVLGVRYLHLRIEEGTDLYVTEHGLPFAKCLLPKNHWEDPEWPDRHRVRLLGSGSVFRVTTKQVDGRSKDIVIKWNRMGQDIPGETAAEGALDGVEFNSPFMEFSLVLEMRNARYESSGQFYTHKPLAIYVPRRLVQAKRLGRKVLKMEAIQRSHAEIELDWNRNYAVIYEWLKGIDAARAYGKGLIDHDGMIGLFDRANRDLRAKGFSIRDNKPRHIIVRPRPNGGARQRQVGGRLLRTGRF